MKQIFVATTNKGKLAEIQEIFETPLVPVDLEIDEVQSKDLEYVARKKTEEAFKQLGKPVIVDDVGLFVEALNDFPGPFVKHLFDAIGNKGILKLLLNEKNRNVRVATVIGYHDGKKVNIFAGEVSGKIAFEPRGKHGFGFDSIVIPDGYELTYAEMDMDEKNKSSHSRAKALVKLKKFLDSQRKQKKI